MPLRKKERKEEIRKKKILISLAKRNKNKKKSIEKYRHSHFIIDLESSIIRKIFGFMVNFTDNRNQCVILCSFGRFNSPYLNEVKVIITYRPFRCHKNVIIDINSRFLCTVHHSICFGVSSTLTYLCSHRKWFSV